jgi:hypothetical protein
VRKLRTLVIAALLPTAGCVSVFGGTSQQIQISTEPPQASCSFERNGETIGIIPQTPGTLTVKKTKYDITIKCNKPGFQETAYFNKSGTDAAIAANIVVDVLLTAGISSIVDSATGADNKYDESVFVKLTPMPLAVAVTPQAPAQ